MGRHHSLAVGIGDDVEITLLPNRIIKIKVEDYRYNIKVINLDERSESTVHQEKRKMGEWEDDTKVVAEVPTRQWVSKGKCDFCGKPLPQVEQLALDDWIPSYWNGDEEVLEPVCGVCVSSKLAFNKEMGDFEVIDDSSCENQDSSRANHPDDDPSAYLYLI